MKSLIFAAILNQTAILSLTFDNKWFFYFFKLILINMQKYMHFLIPDEFESFWKKVEKERHIETPH
jgi:hypothetical protein